MFDAKNLAKNDPNIEDLFALFRPAVLENSINAKTFDQFKVDKTFVDSYKVYPAKKRAMEEEVDDLVEGAWVVMMDYQEKFNDLIRELEKKGEERKAEIEWFRDNYDTITAKEFWKKYPELELKVEWLVARGRWDHTMSDKEYAAALKKDYTWWNLPRDP